MKVFVADFDLFDTIGGGQTFYRSIINRHPTINFFYLAISERVGCARPKNAHPIPFKSHYFPQKLGTRAGGALGEMHYYDFLRANNVAYSVAGLDFDVVELPDYEQFGTFLAPALRLHGVRFGRIVLSMHGSVSTTKSLNWSTEGKVDHSLIARERMQHSTVDIRYGISKSYLDEWYQTVKLEAHYLTPLRFIDLPQPTIPPVSPARPSLNFVGRTEKRKGPDIFVELVWWLPRSSYAIASIIGPESYTADGIGSSSYLHRMMSRRVNDIRLVPPTGQSELARLFAEKTMTILPSRYDSLNLVAIESLLSGCPTAIGSEAGVCRFLRETFPRVPFVTIPMDNIYAGIPDIRAVLANYNAYREQIAEAIVRSNPEITGPDLEAIYASSPVYHDSVRKELESRYAHLMAAHEVAARRPLRRAKTMVRQFVFSHTSGSDRSALRVLRSSLRPRAVKAVLEARLLGSTFRTDAIMAAQIVRAFRLDRVRRHIQSAPERSNLEVAAKLRKLWRIGKGLYVDRVWLWREIARLEQLRGNHLISATYRLRVMRSLGRDAFGDLPEVTRALEGLGFPREAQAASAMYSNDAGGHDRCAALLEHALAEGKKPQPSWQYDFVDDRRRSPAYRVAIIVSLYNAAGKLPQFLAALQLQPMLQRHQAEIVLIDSGSPANEYEAFRQLFDRADIPVVFARCGRRETIQSAWNRGIAMSRSPYLTFLGVDETIHPDCLDTLTAELDADPALDWVQADSIVTNVDRHGRWLSDVMTYDRGDYCQGLVYLETCYLSWVGAVYRRSIHERFGYYDATFGAAGDTEFKNRILPFIKTKAVPRTLGIFWNYQETRTTQSPRAEIEDLRAWYLHRTPAGIEYAFSGQTIDEAKQLYALALGYRKSYCQHRSTDIEYAYHMSRYLEKRSPGTQTQAHFDGTASLLSAYRNLDWIPRGTVPAAVTALMATRVHVWKIGHYHSLGNGQPKPAYEVFNDNRYEQHCDVWTSKTCDAASI